MSDTGIKPTHRHVKRGTEYQHIGTARIQTDVPLQDMDRVEVYLGQGEDDLWARRQVEFHDGRFEPLPATPSHATDTADLVQRLRGTTEEMANAGYMPMEIWDRHSNACLEAADALSALRAENERLKSERDRKAWLANKWAADAEAAEAERDRLQAELARKDAVLRSLAWADRTTDQDGRPVPRCPSCKGIDPTHPSAWLFIREAQGHKPGCALCAALTQTDRTGAQPKRQCAHPFCGDRCGDGGYPDMGEAG